MYCKLKAAFLVLVLLVCAVLLAACTVKKTPMPYGGSKADGMVKLSYTIGSYRQAKVDKEQTRQRALKRCQAWGYENVQHFGSTKECVRYSGFSCSAWRVKLKYQCIAESEGSAGRSN